MSNEEELSKFIKEANSTLTKEQADEEILKRTLYLQSLTNDEQPT